MGNKEGLIEHHTHYKEIDGYDETVWMTRSEHTKLHRRLRKEGKCNIPSEDLAKISIAAGRRTKKGKEQANRESRKHQEKNKDKVTAYQKKWREENKDKHAERRDRHRENHPDYMSDYYQKHKETMKTQSRENYRRKKDEKT